MGALPVADLYHGQVAAVIQALLAGQRVPFEQIRGVRASYGPNDYMQQVLAPYEHKAFARDWMNESPGLAAVSLPAAIPAYAGAKAVGALQGRSGAENPMGQMAAGFTGYGQGLSDIIRRFLGSQQ